MEILELKKTMSEIKNSLGILTAQWSWLRKEWVNLKIGELKIFKERTKRKKIKKKWPESQGSIYYMLSNSVMCLERTGLLHFRIFLPASSLSNPRSVLWGLDNYSKLHSGHKTLLDWSSEKSRIPPFSRAPQSIHRSDNSTSSPLLLKVVKKMSHCYSERKETHLTGASQSSSYA